MAGDHCTMFPEGDWSDCCKQHDLDYAKGSGVSRKVADLKLKRCIRSGGKPKLAKVVYVGVRLFGWLFYRK